MDESALKNVLTDKNKQIHALKMQNKRYKKLNEFLKKDETDIAFCRDDEAKIKDSEEGKHKECLKNLLK
jgi:hypothetical protein